MYYLMCTCFCEVEFSLPEVEASTSNEGMRCLPILNACDTCTVDNVLDNGIYEVAKLLPPLILPPKLLDLSCLVHDNFNLVLKNLMYFLFHMYIWTFTWTSEQLWFRTSGFQIQYVPTVEPLAIMKQIWMSIFSSQLKVSSVQVPKKY